MKTKCGFRPAIDAEALERIWHWTDLASGEFSCLAQVTGDVLVHDVRLFAQTCTQASTTIDEQALVRFLCEHERPEQVRAWIHSHGNLNVFWSQQDDACIEGLHSESFLVSIVVNKRRDLKCRIDLWNPVRLTIDDVSLDVRAPRYNLRGECEATFRRLVTEVRPLPSPWLQQGRSQASPFPDWHGWEEGDELPGWRR